MDLEIRLANLIKAQGPELSRRHLFDKNALRTSAILAGNAAMSKANGEARELLCTAILIFQDDAILLYNLACTCALEHQGDEALRWLEAAVGAGYNNADLLRTDPDLDSIRDHPEFSHIISLVIGESKTEEASPSPSPVIPPKPYRLRPFYTLRDAPQLHEIDVLCFADQSYELEFFSEAVNHFGRVQTVVAVAPGGEIVGYVIGQHERDGVASITSLAVRPDYQGSGVGSALLTYNMGQLQSSGYTAVRHIYLECDAANDRVVRFYQRHGFSVAEFLRKYYRDGRDAFLMRRSVD